MKYILMMCLFFSMTYLNAQIEEIHDDQQVARSKGSDPSIIKKFKFTSQVNDTITIKIINPRGELMQLAVRDYPMAAWQSLYFEQEALSYLPGNYQIIVEGKEGRRFTRRMIINREESSRKKS